MMSSFNKVSDFNLRSHRWGLSHHFLFAVDGRRFTTGSAACVAASSRSRRSEADGLCTYPPVTAGEIGGDQGEEGRTYIHTCTHTYIHAKLGWFIVAFKNKNKSKTKTEHRTNKHKQNKHQKENALPRSECMTATAGLFKGFRAISEILAKPIVLFLIS